ncbi:Glyco-hydro-79C domain-containing protein [Fusarium falciforme]|uniref:Glyco-hydro-79C domain-containing protein n=1 Tax=Fusarium falciforme TaxID=195108 RepID=UPI002300AC94|nr:Glyco-hydro-79C domain-containing protein [Fusarium falciforme]WAO88942.1 Glyco-hydro-79C domain-containing protein [Fusarium falciforme]
MVQFHHLMFFGLANAASTAPSYSVPATQPKDAVAIDAAPVGASFEFFMWPSYMTNISLTRPCIDHFNKIYGQKMPIRIGGTTQDRATYDPTFGGYVSYKVDDPLEAPMSLTYGPRFFDLIKSFQSETILGFNRGLDNRTNTFAAIMEAKSRVQKYLWALELGNEPDLFYKYWQYPVAEAPWNETQEAADAADWAQDFINHWKSPLPILAGGGYAIPFEIEPGWPNLPYLVNSAYNQTVKDATKVYNGHLYAFSNATGDDLAVEMTHQRTVDDLNLLPISTARSVGRPYILGETGFHGLDYEMDATFGSAIQAVDKTLRALSLGIQRLFYHQGTINQAFFNWWLSDQANAPFYGAYFGALAAAGGDHIVASDDGTDPYAQYIIYREGRPLKLVFINTDYYPGSGSRSKTTFTAIGLKNSNVKAVRMTAPSSETKIPLQQTDASLEPSIGGQTFSNENCRLRGARKMETLKIQKGQLRVTLEASEALIVYL